MTEGFEPCKADGFPRHWKEWLGKRDILIKIPPEMDVFTKQVRKFDPIVETDYFFYLVDWNLRPVVERWENICDFVKRVVPKDFRLKENLEEMALPLAANKTDGVTLEPEDVVIIPIPLEFQEKNVKIITTKEVDQNVPRRNSEKAKQIVKCDEEGCSFESEGSYAKNSVRMHKNKRHPKVETSA